MVNSKNAYLQTRFNLHNDLALRMMVLTKNYIFNSQLIKQVLYKYTFMGIMLFKNKVLFKNMASNYCLFQMWNFKTILTFRNLVLIK